MCGWPEFSSIEPGTFVAGLLFLPSPVFSWRHAHCLLKCPDKIRVIIEPAHKRSLSHTVTAGQKLLRLRDPLTDYIFVYRRSTVAIE